MAGAPIICAIIIAAGIYLGLKGSPPHPRYQIIMSNDGVFKADTLTGHVWRYNQDRTKAVWTESFVLIPSESRRASDFLDGRPD
jgi:hypothetical protein